jgi:O-antigen/teichoic acid export membrane protein
MISKLFTLLGAENPKRYVTSTLWIFVTKIISILVSLAATFYVARTLGPQNFGELNYAVSIVNLLAFFSAIASTSVICRDLIKRPEAQRTILGTAWVLTVLGTILTILCAVIVTLFLPHDNITLYIIGLLCLAQICSPFSVAQNIFYAHAKTKQLSLAQLGLHISVSVAKIVAMTFDQGVLVLAAIMFAEQFIMAIVTIVLYKRHTHIKLWEWNFDSQYAKKLAIDSIPFVFISMSILVSGRIDQVFIKHFIDTTTVGLYSVAVQLTEIWQVLPQIVLAALFPALVNAHLSNNRYRKRIVALCILVAVYCLGVSLTTYLLAPLLIPLIYGPAFVSSIPLLQIYTWSLLGTVLGFLITNILVTENQRWIQIMVGLVPMLTNILLNLLWVPVYGAPGAAWATVVSYSMAPLIPFFYSAIRQKLYASQAS